MREAWEKLFSLVEFEPTTGCWLWPRSLGSGGYPDFRVNGERYSGHRLSYAFNCGDIPDGMRVCHTCDTPPCVNPQHLFVGTARDNTLDMVRKGRGGRPPHKYGASHHKARLTEGDVREIRVRFREPGMTAAALSKVYPASPGAIYCAAVGLSWRHIPMPDEGEHQPS